MVLNDNSYGLNLGRDVQLYSEQDELILNVINAYQSSNKSLWECAENTWKLFENHGLYERDFTETLVNSLGVQKDTIYHWRKAWDLRLKVLEASPNFLFDGLSISHFYHAADFVNDMGIDWVLEWLAEAQADGWSSRKLAAELDMATNESGTANWLYSRLSKVALRLERLYADSEMSGLPDWKRRKLRDAIFTLQDVIRSNE